MRRLGFRRPARNLARDQRGAALVEFALLAPAFLTLLFGVIQVGFHMQNYNAVRNLASDGARFAVVAYQRGNVLSTDAIQAAIESRGVGPKYGLNADRLTVTVEQPGTSSIAGVREMNIQIDYAAPDFLGFVSGDALNLVYERPVFLLIPG